MPRKGEDMNDIDHEALHALIREKNKELDVRGDELEQNHKEMYQVLVQLIVCYERKEALLCELGDISKGLSDWISDIYYERSPQERAKKK